jgi:hypothetical protein
MPDEEWGCGESGHETHGVAEAIRELLSARRPRFEDHAHGFASSAGPRADRPRRAEELPLPIRLRERVGEGLDGPAEAASAMSRVPIIASFTSGAMAPPFTPWCLMRARLPWKFSKK